MSLMNEGEASMIPVNEKPPQGAPSSESVREGSDIEPLVSYFLANITHEFRTPLAALNASVEYMLDDFDLLSTSEIRELLHSIHLSVTGLQTLIDNLIESTRIEAGQFAVRTWSIDLSAVISEAIRFTRPLISRRCQSIVVEQLESLPFVKGDPSRLTQVMVNLLSHASKFGPMNQTILIGFQESGRDQLRVTIAHQGSGFGPDYQEQLFSHSIKSITSCDRPYGTELGLSVAATIIEEHGGKIGIEQRPGGGSVYWFTIPTAKKTRGG